MRVSSTLQPVTRFQTAGHVLIRPADYAGCQLWARSHKQRFTETKRAKGQPSSQTQTHHARQNCCVETKNKRSCQATSYSSLSAWQSFHRKGSSVPKNPPISHCSDALNSTAQIHAKKFYKTPFGICATLVYLYFLKLQTDT